MQENEDLDNQIYFELDIVRILSTLSKLALEQETEELSPNSYAVIFEEIYKRSWKISEMVENIDNMPKAIIRLKKNYNFK